MHGGMILSHIEKDKFLVSNKGEGKDIEPLTVKLTVKMLKELMPNVKGKKPELLKHFMESNIAVPKKITRPKTYMTEETRKKSSSCCKTKVCYKEAWGFYSTKRFKRLTRVILQGRTR
jgi:hypothetical protein